MAQEAPAGTWAGIIGTAMSSALIVLAHTGGKEGGDGAVGFAELWHAFVPLGIAAIVFTIEKIANIVSARTGHAIAFPHTVAAIPPAFSDGQWDRQDTKAVIGAAVDDVADLFAEAQTNPAVEYDPESKEKASG